MSISSSRNPLRDLAITECLDNYCITFRSDDPDTVEFHVGEWCTYMSESFVRYASNKASRIALYIEESSALNPNLCEWIGKYMAPFIVEFYVSGSNQYTWKTHFLPIMQQIMAIEVFQAKKIDWLSDNISNQICTKFVKSLRSMVLESVANIGDNTLFHVGKKLNCLTQLHLECCPKMSDVGIAELSKRLHFSSFRLTHNVYITDSSVRAVVGRCEGLTDLVLTNCPNLTDSTIATLYEATAAWGNKRNTETLSLTSLELRDNNNFTYSALNYIATANTKLQRLDIRDCLGIDLNKGLMALENLQFLESLKIGPTACPVDSDSVVESLLFQMANLKVFHMNGLNTLCDTEIGELLEGSVVLEELVLSDMDFGSRSIEALCSNCPNIVDVSLCGSSTLSDADVRCLMTICLGIKAVVVQRCPLLTDGAFTRCLMLKHLTKLDVGYCSPYLTGYMLGSLTDCALTTLVLDGLDFEPSVWMHQLTTKTILAVKTLSLRDCPRVGNADCPYLTSKFTNCTNIDLSGCVLNDSMLVNAWQPNPFLTFHSELNFLGYKMTTANKSMYLRYHMILLRLKMHYAARIWQRAHRKHKEYRALKLEQEQQAIKEYRIYLVSKVQSLIRMFVLRKRAKKQLRAAMTITCAVRLYFFNQLISNTLKAKAHYKRHQKKIIVDFLRLAKNISRQQLGKLVEKLEPKLELRLRRRIFTRIVLEQKDAVEEFYCNSVLVLWEIWLLKRVVRGWRAISGNSSKRSQLLLKIFLNCVPIATHNSIRQRALQYGVDHFSNRRVILPAWACFCDDYLRARMADKLIPMAIEYAKRSFFNSTVRKTYQAIVTNKVNRYFKRQAKLKAEKHRLNHLRNQFFSRAEKVAVMKQAQKALMSYTIAYFLKRLKRVSMFRCTEYCIRSVIFRRNRDASDKFWKEYRCRLGLQRAVDYLTMQKVWRDMKRRASDHFSKALRSINFANWKKYWDTERNLVLRLRERYHRKILKKIFVKGFKRIVEMKAEYLQSLAEAVADEGEREKAVQRLNKAVTVLKAHYRGYKAREYVTKYRVQSLYAIMILQRSVRKSFAIRELKRLKRHYKIREMKAQLVEMDLMRAEDLEMRFINYKLKAVTTIQRCFRGYKGRGIAYVVKAALIREQNTDYYDEQQNFRHKVEAQKRAKVAQDNLRHKAATQIQKIARGRIARKQFIVIKRASKMEKCAILIQREYRRRLAQLKLEALTRDKNGQLTFFRVRQQRGVVLRLFGLFNRRTQTMFKAVMDNLGIDPKTFNYKPKELYAEVKQDYEILKMFYRRERQIFKEHRFNKIEKLKARRKKVIEAGWSLRVYDSVRIIEPDHPFYGHTGIIVRIDQSLVGVPLYEVRLDRFNRQTFIRMTTDSLVYYDTESGNHMGKVARKPLIRENLVQPFIVFGTDPTNPFCSRKNVIAAWTIQRGWRCHRARKVAGRLRFEFWKRAVDNQKTLYEQLADANALTRQAYSITGYLGMRAKRAIKYDEMQHPLFPGRYGSTAKKTNEKSNIKKEFEIKTRQRSVFIEKASMTRGKEFFSTGASKMAGAKQLSMMFSMLFGVFSSGKLKLNDVQGARGARMMVKQKTTVAGMDFYDFDQFKGSPHVRYTSAFLYQGEWTGIPMFTPLRPHGEGMVIFFDGWGFAREDKVLYLTIICCRHLTAADLDTSDPYANIFCNGTNVQSSVKWSTLNPVYYESFEIDVTDPSAKLNIRMMDKDFFGSDEFLGQAELRVGDYLDGKERTEVHQLRGEDATISDPFDLGEIEIRIRWAERVFEDDIRAQEARIHAVTKMQSFFRKTIARFLVRRKRKEYAELMQMIRVKAVKITSVCRMRFAKKELIRNKRMWLASIRIQKRIRIYIAKKVVRLKRLQKVMAIIIQKYARGYNARMLLFRMKRRREEGLRKNVTCIQKWGRRLIAQVRIDKLCASRGIVSFRARAFDDDDSSVASFEGSVDSAGSAGSLKKKKKVKKSRVSSWINTYGRDPEYGLRRNRRITEVAFKRMLKLKYTKLLTKPFGVVYVDHYPAKLSEEELAMQQKGEEALTNREDFVAVFVPPFFAKAYSRTESIKLLTETPYQGIFHIPSTVLMRQSVDFIVTVIQCCIRKKQALKKKRAIMRVHAAFSILQKKFRKRHEKYHSAAKIITSLFHRIYANKVVRIRRRERRAALIIQCAFRCYRARSYIFNCQSVKNATALRCSSFIPKYGPEKCLDLRDDTFWMSDSPKEAEIRVEFRRKELITSVWIMCSTHEASPNFVSISYVANKKSKKFERLFNKVFLRQLKGLQWHKFDFPVPIETKYFKVTFEDNYSDSGSIGVRQIRFQRCRETTPIIEEQPKHYVLDPGPAIGSFEDIILKCKARAWPHPTFQWYRNSRPIPGATSPELRLRLYSPASTTLRTYRCKKCAMVCKKVPVNAYHVRCRNCSVVFSFNEAFVYDQFVQKLRDEEAVLNEELEKLTVLLQRMKAYHDPKHEALLQDVTKRSEEINVKLVTFREARYLDKYDIENINKFSDEGIYCCHVQNTRGGGMVMVTKSIRAVVAVEHAEPFLLDVRPQFNPRPQVIRKKWCVYSSILGTFTKGKLMGIVTIRYADSSFYEGPFIDEEWVDTLGRVNLAAKAKNHYGIFTTPDKRVFEGYNVDNHFDPFNIQLSYKLTLPNGEVYDGMFADESYHGIGIYYFKDGSVYEGEWHRGTRFGHGQLRSSQGWTYEGFFDTDRRHGQGSINWTDGSFYIGEWYFEKITGRGMYISRLRDLYKGDLVDSIFHGFGELLYSSGAKYSGEFRNGKKHGKGIYVDVSGNEYYGIFVEDEMDGEVVVKAIIKIEEIGQDNYEVKVGVYERGKFIKWKVKFSHPIATKQFIKLFDDNKDMYDSVYSLILAKNLPDVPDGVDMNNPDVQRIVTRIRDEAGDLVSEHALSQATERIEAVMKPITLLREELKTLKAVIEFNEARALTLEQDATMYSNRFLVMIDIAEKEAKKAEQYWVDDPRELRGKHSDAVKALSAVDKESFFDFKSHRFPPPFVKKIMDATSCLLGASRDWKQQQILLSDSAFNAREGDEQALRFRYDCKLVHLLKDYSVYTYCEIDQGEFGGLLGKIISDPRFRRDSYYIESCGPVAPIMVDWIKINYQFITAAKAVVGILKSSEEKKVEAYRVKALATKKKEEIAPLLLQIEADKQRMFQVEDELTELSIALAKANNMLDFLKETFEVSKSKEKKLDYYERLEKTMEQKKDFLQIETALRVAVDGVELRLEDERHLKMKLAAARGQVYVEEPVTHPQLVDWIQTEVREQHAKVLDLGMTLGYSYEPEPNAITEEQAQVYINLVVDLVILRMNERFNDLASATTWVSNKGHKFNTRFLYILTWKYWKEIAVQIEDDKAIAAWESIFGGPEDCAIMSVEARINTRMSALAREQARVWANKYPLEIEKAENTLAYRFYTDYPEDTARCALDVSEDTSGAVPPSMLAACICWMKLHPGAMNEVRDALGLEMAEEFAQQFKSETAADAFRIVNNIATDAEMVWLDKAIEWRTYNSDAYDEAAEEQITNMAKEFKEGLPANANYAMEAATIMNHHEISEYIIDLTVKGEYEQKKAVYFNAKCFGIRNQGLLRAANDKIKSDNATKARKMWGELEVSTEKFRKGSYVFVSEEAKENPALDRFFGFRARLLAKHAWLYGYLCFCQMELVKDVRSMESVDPFGKAFHNIRPSELKKVMREKDETFQEFKASIEVGLKEIFTKVSLWNTYFGMSPILDEHSDDMRVVWGVAKDLILEIQKEEKLLLSGGMVEGSEADMDPPVVVVEAAPSVEVKAEVTSPSKGKAGKSTKKGPAPKTKSAKPAK